MKGFIEITDIKENKKSLLNIHFIQNIWDSYISMYNGDMDWKIEVKENYEEIKSLIEIATGEADYDFLCKAKT